MTDANNNCQEQVEPAVLFNVYVKPPWTRHMLVWFVLFGVTLIVTVITGAIIFTNLASLPPLLLLINGMMLGGSIAIAVALGRFRGRERVIHAARSHTDAIATRIATELEGESPLWDITEIPRRLTETTSSFAKNGHINRIIRLGWAGDWNHCVPFEVQISPRILDENDPVFIELENATNEVKSITTGHGKAPSSMPRFLRTIARNIEVRIGNWIGLILLGNGLAIECRLLIKTGVFSAWMAVYGIAFVVLAILTLRAPSESNHQWLVVNGGLLSRRSRFGATQSRLHLFDRRKSLLCLYQRRKGAWIVCAADSETVDSAIITRREVDMLLRAWLSPLPPPDVSKLVDFQ